MKRILLLGLILSLSAGVRAAVLPAEKLLPDNTQFVFTVPDFNKAKDNFKSSPLAQLWQDASMKSFRDAVMKKLRDEYLASWEHDLGAHLDEYTNLAKGQLTIAYLPAGDGAKEAKTQTGGFLLLLDTKDKSSQLKTNLADLKKKWVDAGKPIRSEKIRDVEFSVVVLSGNDAAKKPDEPAPDAAPTAPAPKVELYIGQAESLLIVANAPSGVEKVLAAMAGAPVKTLDETPAFAAYRGPLFRDATIFGWLNTKGLVEALRHRDEDVKELESETNPFSFKWDKLVTATGLGGLKSVASSYVQSPDGALLNVALGVPESGRAGIFKILAGEAKDCNPPNFVPADAVKFQRWRIDGQKAWATAQKMVGEFSTQWLNNLNLILGVTESAAKEKDPEFSMKKNLFGNLGDDIVSYSKAPKAGSGAEGGDGPGITLVGSPNGEQLASALRSVVELMGQQAGAIKSREFRGHKIYSLEQPAVPGVTGAAAAPHYLNYAASGGYLAISTDSGMIEEYLRSSENEGKSLRETPGLTDAMAKVAGAGASMFGYSNDAEEMRVAFESLKKGPAQTNPVGGSAAVAAASMVLGAPSEAKVKEWFDFTLLPPFEQVSKYFSFTVYGGSANQDGLNLKIFVPVPPQIRGK